MSFKPSLDQQRSCPTCTDSLLNGDFTITYDVNRESPGNVQVPRLADSSSRWGEGWWGEAAAASSAITLGPQPKAVFL